MNYKATATLAVVLSLLVAYLYFVERPSAEKKATEVTRIFSFSETDIRQVTLTGAQGTFVIQPGHSPWITAPIKTMADRGSVSALTRQITDLTPIQTIEQNGVEADLTPFGLDPPAYSVDVQLKDSPTHRLLLGGENMVGQVYARVGKTIYLVESTLKASLHKGLNDWRRHELFDFSVPDVTSLRMEGTGETLIFEKRGVEWIIKTEPEAKADPSKVSSLISNLSFLRGEGGGIDEDKEARVAAWGAPLLTVTVGLEGKEQRGVFYGSPDEPNFVYGVTTSEAPLYKVARDRFDSINKPAADFVHQEQKEKALSHSE